MTVQEMHTAFKLGLDKSNSSFVPSFESNEIDYWLNFAMERFIKQRLYGNNVRKEAYPNTQKRNEDLYTLTVQNPNLGLHSPNFQSPITAANVQTVTSPLPKNFYHLIYSYATYQKTKDPYSGNLFTRDIIFIDDVVYQDLSRIWGGLANGQNGNSISINKKVYGRLIGANEHSPALNVPSNSPYGVTNQVAPLPRYLQIFLPSFSILRAAGITYLRNWEKLNIQQPTNTPELPVHTHQEIVDIAVNSVLENIGDPRYQSNTSELNKQE